MDPLVEQLSYYSSLQSASGASPTSPVFELPNDTVEERGDNNQTPLNGKKDGEQQQQRQTKGSSGSEKGVKRVRMVDGEDSKVKKTRQSQSCDACRARKVRCDRPPPGTNTDIDPNLPTKDVCSHCRHLSMACTFDYKPKKRGPPNQYLKKLVGNVGGNEVSGSGTGDDTGAQSPPRPAQTFDELSSDLPPPPSPPPRRVYPPNPTKQETSSPYITTTSYYRSGLASDQGGPGPGTLAEQRALHATALVKQGSGAANLNGKDVEAVWEPTLMMAINATASPRVHSSWKSTSDATSSTSYFPPSALSASHDRSIHPIISSPVQSQKQQRPSHSPVYTSPPYHPFPHNPHNPFDVILPRGLLYHIVDLYFDYIYALIPCIHRPTFIKDLHDHREDQLGQDEFIALVMAVVANTLVQIPRAFVPLPRSEVKALVVKCNSVARVYLTRNFEEVNASRFVLYYLTGFTSGLLGYKAVAAAHSGANWGLMLRFRLHEEESYVGLDPIEQEMRRRLFWLQFSGDKSFAVIESTATFSSDDICTGVNLPAEMDDEFITASGYLKQPEDRPSILSGFVYASKLWRLTGQVLDKRRRDRSQPPSGLLLQMRLNEINELYDQVMGLMDDCPEPLRLNLDGDTKSTGVFSDDWNMHASKEVRSLFLDPKASKAVVKDAFLVQQANIYVTQQMIRYVVLQYRDDLLTLQEEVAAQARQRSMSESRSTPRRQSSSQRRVELSRALFSDEEKDQVASDLLAVLQMIPIQVIAVNSMPLVQKVRFVASTLLDALNNPRSSSENRAGNGEGKDDHSATQRMQKSQSYLWDFVRILSEIETLYAMTDDEPART